MNKSISIKTTFGPRVDSIWNKPIYHGLPFQSLGYDVLDGWVDPSRKKSILFIGINPSILPSNIPSAKSSISSLSAGAVVYPYFKPLKQMADDCGAAWTVADLLWIQSSSLLPIKTAIGKDPTFRAFCQDQYELSWGMIAAYDADVLVANGAYIYDMMKMFGGITYSWDNKIGTYRITSAIPGLEGKPIFFTSMLSGQRALDCGSRERLRWQIKKVFGLRTATAMAKSIP